MTGRRPLNSATPKPGMPPLGYRLSKRGAYDREFSPSSSPNDAFLNTALSYTAQWPVCRYAERER
jgi:hypothetical protein